MRIFHGGGKGKGGTERVSNPVCRRACVGFPRGGPRLSMKAGEGGRGAGKEKPIAMLKQMYS